jgi:hypothetical protein
MRIAEDHEGSDKTSFLVCQLFVFSVLVAMQSLVSTVHLSCPSTLLTPADAQIQFASLVINTIGYDRWQTMLYTAPSGVVQALLLWIGIKGCWFFSRNRTHVMLALIIPPLAGNVLLLKLPLDAAWGLIAASWLASCITAGMNPLLSLPPQTSRTTLSALS